MDSTTRYHHKQHTRSNKKHRIVSDKREKFPDGYVEHWSNTSVSHSNSIWPVSDTLTKSLVADIKSHKHTGSNHDVQVSKKSEKLYSDKGLVPVDKSLTHDLSKSKQQIKYNPTSIILSTQGNIMLTKDTSYDIRFSTGVLDGTGLHINETGNQITFDEDGSYRFEIYGEASPFSDVEVKLVFHSDSFQDNMKNFTEITVPKCEGRLELRGLPTILPVHKNQTVTARLVPEPDETIILMTNTRLLIHRVS